MVTFTQKSFKIIKINGIEKHGFGVRLRQIHPRGTAEAHAVPGPLLFFSALLSCKTVVRTGRFGSSFFFRRALSCFRCASGRFRAYSVMSGRLSRCLSRHSNSLSRLRCACAFWSAKKKPWLRDCTCVLQTGFCLCLPLPRSFRGFPEFIR